MFTVFMAFVRLPMSILRVFTWILMGLAAWLLATAEKAYASVTVTFSSVSGILDVSDDGSANTISVYADGDSVIVEDNDGTTIVSDGEDTIKTTDVFGISISGSDGADEIDVTRVSSGVGFTNVGHDDVTIQGGTGNDTILGRDSLGTFDEGDSLMGDGGADCILGGAGPDHIWGGDGNDTLLAGDGADDAIGGAGEDVVEGGDGDDDLSAYLEESTLSDGEQDTLRGQGGENDESWSNAVPDDDFVNGVEFPND